MYCRRLALAFCVSALLSACGGSKSTFEAPAKLEDLNSSVVFTPQWRADSGASHAKERLILNPAISGDILISVSPRGHVRAFDRHSGARLWEQRLGIELSAPAAIADGVVVVAGHGGDLYALNADNGTQLWHSHVSSEVLARPAISANIITVRTVDGKLSGFSAQEGVRLWTYEQTVPVLSLRGTSRPVVFQDLVFSGFDNGRIAALDNHSGKVRWEVQVSDARGRTELERMVDIDSAPLIDDYSVYIATYQGHLVAFSLNNGSVLWKKEISNYGDLAADANAVYLSDAKGHVWAFDRRNGDSLWKQDTLQGRQLSAPVVHGDYVVVGDFQGYIHSLRRDNGSQAGRFQVSKAPIHAAALSLDEVLIVQSSDGTLMALQLASGK
jgi:outer membrane protein assembly factor BamB